MASDPRRVLVGAVLAVFTSAVASTSKIPVTVLVPVIEGSEVLRQTDPTGASFPVFRAAPDTPFFARIRRTLAEEPAQASLRLDRYARNARIAEEAAKGRKPGAGLTMPMALLVSREEGGFARSGFWLQARDGRRELIPAGYVDLVVRESDVEDGSFEEILCGPEARRKWKRPLVISHLDDLFPAAKKCARAMASRPEPGGSRHGDRDPRGVALGLLCPPPARPAGTAREAGRRRHPCRLRAVAGWISGDANNPNTHGHETAGDPFADTHAGPHQVAGFALHPIKGPGDSARQEMCSNPQDVLPPESGRSLEIDFRKKKGAPHGWKR